MFIFTGKSVPVSLTQGKLSGEREMKSLALLSAVATAALLGTSVVKADVLVGSDGYGWQLFPETLNNYSNPDRPFWDNPSRDVARPNQGGPLNIGNFLAGPYRLNNNAKNPDISLKLDSPKWWGAATAVGGGAFANNTADSTIHFARGADDSDVVSVGTIVVERLMQSSDHSKYHQLGVYNADQPTEQYLLSFNGSTAFFNFDDYGWTNWGFYFVTFSGTYYMDASMNTADKDVQHFAVFQTSAVEGAEVYHVGVEDMPSGTQPPEGLGDFNDFVFTFRSIAGTREIPGTPEPASLALLGAGVVGLIMRRRR